jgi:hypothetical protein
MSAHDRLAIFTICSNNYVPMARVLLGSAGKHHPEADLFLIVADRVVVLPGLYDPAWAVIPAEQLDIPGFASFAFRYDIMEFNTAIKPFAFRHLLEERGYDHVVYFDPDIVIYRRLAGVLDSLRAGCSFVLTPHLDRPVEAAEEPDDVSIMRAGIYNLGFLAIGRCEESLRIVQWWARRLRFQCVSAQDQGIFVDQKFIDLVPGFARLAHISHDVTLNVAYWNLSHRSLGGEPGAWTVDGQPLTFFHFSGFDPHRPGKLSKFTRRLDGDMPAPLLRLTADYVERLAAAGRGTLPAQSYAYGHFASGAAIHPLVRLMFRQHQADWPTDPFWTYEVYLDEPSPQVTQTEPRLRVSNLMKFIYDATPELHRNLDLADPARVADLVHWFVFRAEHDILLDERLVAPALARMEHDAVARACDHADGRRADAAVIGYLRTESGVGEAARQTLETLAGTGMRVEGIDVDLNVMARRVETRTERYLVERSTAKVQIFQINADQLPLVVEDTKLRLDADAVRVCVPFWELSRFPVPWLSAFEQVDEIWAPSRFIQRALMRDLRKPVVHIPVAIDFLPPPPRPRHHFCLPEDAFLFFFAFDFLSFADRKNPSGTVAAFRVFRSRVRSGRAKLVVKSMNGALAPAALAAFRAEIAEEPDILLIDATMTREDTLALITVVDCVISLHRSEGFGLLVAEAMLLGKPVIATDYSATIELISSQTGFPVGYRLVPVGASQYPFADNQVWADPDIVHAAWHMARIFCEPDSELVRPVVLRAYDTVRRRHGRHRVAVRQTARSTIGCWRRSAS